MNPKRSAWSLEMGTVASIPIRVHITFLLLVVWLAFGTDTPSPLREAGFVILVFTCVLAHELSHALMAKRFGVQTKEITLYPFGGIASIMAQPTPKAELFIAIVGPITNLVIAAGLYPITEIGSLVNKDLATLTLVDRLFITNIALAVFNLLPALPMDGGRVTRAVLSLLKVKQPTRVAARLSQGICLMMGIAALSLEQPMLLVIAFIIFFGAVQEYVRAEARVVAVAFTVRDAMIPRSRLETFTHGTTVSKALRTALTSLQPLYPIMHGDRVIGIIHRDDILEHAATQPDEYLGSITLQELPTIDVEAPLSAAFTTLEETGTPVLIVTHNGEFIGLLVHDRLSDFLLLQGLRDKRSKDDEAEWSTPL
jgi:Zn-dependent protease